MWVCMLWHRRGLPLLNWFCTTYYDTGRNRNQGIRTRFDVATIVSLPFLLLLLRIVRGASVDVGLSLQSMKP